MCPGLTPASLALHYGGSIISLNAHFWAYIVIFWNLGMKSHYATVQNEPESLHNRMIRRRFSDTHGALLFLEYGKLQMMDMGPEITGPALCYWPPNRHIPVVLEAGSRAFYFGLSDTILLDAIGARSESVHLRMLVESPFQTSLSNTKIIGQVASLCGWLVDEIENAESSSPMSMAAFLRLILIAALRMHSPDVQDKSAEKTDLLRRFRHLVELHYRDHWQMVSYADTLGIDYDRLHRICKRETGRSPAELVHERLTAEAKARLENSGFPLKKIAADLGFSDASRFSHFFKRRTDMSPGAYRAIVSRPDEEDLLELRRGFADWP